MAKERPDDGVLLALDRGERVIIPTSRRRILFILTVAVTLGVLLAVLLALVVRGSIEQHGDWLLIATSLRVWAIAAVMIACLVLAPVGTVLRLRRSEALVLSRDGIALEQRGHLLPATVVTWSDIEGIELDNLRPGAPRFVTYRLTEEAAARRDMTRPHQRRRYLPKQLELTQRELHPLLVAAHERYGQPRGTAGPRRQRRPFHRHG